MASEFEPVCGYWLGPQVRFGERTGEPPSVPGLPREDSVAYPRRRLSCGLDVTATEHGLVLFNFGGYTAPRPSAQQLQRAPFEGKNAEASVVAPALVELLNAHQLCLLDAIGSIEGDEDVWAPSARPVSVPTLWTGSVDGSLCTPNADAVDYLEFVNEERSIRLSLFRFPIAVVNRSFDTFERLTESPEVIRASHAVLHAVAHCEEFRFDQGLIMGWTAVDVLLQHLWQRRVEDQASNVALTLTKERRKPLLGMSSAAVADHLLLNGTIDGGVYRALRIARSERNRWAHGLTPPSYEAATSAIHAAHRLTELATGCRFDVHPTVAAPPI